MAKASIVKKYSIAASGILYMSENDIFIENPDTGEAVNLKDLLNDFADRSVKLSVNYDENYGDET